MAIKQNQRMTQKIENAQETVKKLIKESNLNEARLVLRQKRFLQNLLDKSKTKLLEIEQLVENMEIEKLMEEISHFVILSENNAKINMQNINQMNDEEMQTLNEILSKSLSESDETNIREEMEQYEREYEQTISK